tara:strand:+ start:337 stop:582 length:246 start_codon:yes stop_codon:yes gene_type:complete
VGLPLRCLVTLEVRELMEYFALTATIQFNYFCRHRQETLLVLASSDFQYGHLGLLHRHSLADQLLHFIDLTFVSVSSQIQF